jgi:threonine aldolase
MLDRVIDLRSDTVTRPSEAMRETMALAPVGDDVYGEDPTVNELEAFAADLTGKEASIFVPSGSMANLIAQLVHTERGDMVILGEKSHCMLFEAGAGAAIAGVQYHVVPGDGRFTAESIEEELVEQTLHGPGTGLVWVENTHNMGGGLVFPLAEIRRIAVLCRSRRIPLHMDGARVFNAGVAGGVGVREIAAEVDSLSFCLSKGLGAPVGSMVCGSTELIEKSRRIRKQLGGGMRQAGIVAAAGLYALQNNVDRLYQDHFNAKRLAGGLANISGVEVSPKAVETNIVMATIKSGWGTAAALAAASREKGVLFHALDKQTVRLVTHLDVSTADIDRAVKVLKASLTEQRERYY